MIAGNHDDLQSEVRILCFQENQDKSAIPPFEVVEKRNGGKIDQLQNREYLDASPLTEPDSLGHPGARRIDHRNQTEEAKILHGEVDVLRVEVVANRKLSFVQLEIAEAQHSLAKTSQGFICLKMKTPLFRRVEKKSIFD